MRPGPSLRVWFPRTALLLAVLPLACGPPSAVEELRKEILFYPWPHGGSLSHDPPRVAELNADKLHSLKEIEDFDGTLEEWVARTDPVQRIRVGPGDFALGGSIFFYYLASLRRPAVSPQLQIQITRTGPDGAASLDHMAQDPSSPNRLAQSGGVLFSMVGLGAGEHRLTVEVLDGDVVAARGELLLEYDPGPGGA